METLFEIGKFIGLFIGLFASVVIIGGSIGIFFCRRGEKYAKREIKKHNAEVRESICRNCTQKCSISQP